MSAEILEQVASGFHGAIDIIALHRARRACGDSVGKREHHRGLVIEFGESRSDDTDNSLVPIFVVDNDSALVGVVLTERALIDSFAPSQITIHARLGKQQYKGECDIDSFERIIDGVSSKIVYNGDIIDCAGIDAIGERFKNIDTVMIGRALLSNPALAREYNGGAPLSPGEWLEFISSLFYYYSDTLQGDAHILAKMKPYWEYAPEFVDRKVLKLVKKSVSVAKYSAAVDTFAASIR